MAEEVWSIGADESLQTVVEDPRCPPLLRQALTGPVSWQVRSETSVGRALSAARALPRWAAALLALGATVTAGEGDETAEVPLAEADLGQVRTLHVRPSGLRWGEAQVARTPADEPIVAAAVAVRVEDGVVREARGALAGVWPEAVRLAEAIARLEGGVLDEERVRAVAAAVEEEVAPRGDFRGSEAYRRAMAGVVTRRVLTQCMD